MHPLGVHRGVPSMLLCRFGYTFRCTSRLLGIRACQNLPICRSERGSRVANDSRVGPMAKDFISAFAKKTKLHSGVFDTNLPTSPGP